MCVYTSVAASASIALEISISSLMRAPHKLWELCLLGDGRRLALRVDRLSLSSSRMLQSCLHFLLFLAAEVSPFPRRDTSPRSLLTHGPILQRLPGGSPAHPAPHPPLAWLPHLSRKTTVQLSAAHFQAMLCHHGRKQPAVVGWAAVAFADSTASRIATATLTRRPPCLVRWSLSELGLSCSVTAGGRWPSLHISCWQLAGELPSAA